MRNLKTLADVARSMEAPDIVIRNATVLNVFTREWLPEQSVWIKNGRFAYVGPNQEPLLDEDTRVIDLGGKFCVPGLIEGHTHILNRCDIEEFVRYAVPSGMTTVITETIELATNAGLDGIVYFVDGLRDQPIRFYYTAPPLCGLTAVEEERAPSNEDLLPLLKDPMCLGVGEIYWGNMLMENEQGARVRELAEMALALGKRVEGHSAGAGGGKLQAYADLGVSSCHEPIDEQQVIERLRLGLTVMIRQGAIRKELDGVKGVFDTGLDLRRLVLSTDSVDPEGFIEEGSLDAVVRSALALGVDPAFVYQMVTINVAEHFRLDHELGSISPGKMADLVVIPGPEDYRPESVMRSGKFIYEEGRLSVEPKPVTYPDRMFRCVNVSDYPEPRFPEGVKVRAMELVTRLVTKEAVVERPDPDDDLLMVFALDKHGGGQSFTGLLKGYGLTRGACGSTMCWDTGDMIVVGKDARSIGAVIERLKETGGGAVFAVGDEIVQGIPRAFGRHDIPSADEGDPGRRPFPGIGPSGKRRPVGKAPFDDRYSRGGGHPTLANHSPRIYTLTG